MGVFDLVGRLKYFYPVRMEKEVLVYNGKLTLMMVFLQLSVLGFIFYMFYSSKQYLVESTPQMTPMAWRSGMSAEEYQAGVDADANSPVCQGETKRKYDFQYSGDSYFVYADNHCVTIPQSERAVKTGNTIIYYPTYFMEEQTRYIYDATQCAILKNQTQYDIPAFTQNKCGEALYNWGSHCPSYTLDSNSQQIQECEIYVRKNFLIKGVSKQKMEFSHVYEDSDPETLSVEKGKSAWTSSQVEQQKAKGLKVREVLSIVEIFENGDYKEFDCNKPKKGQCRFPAGTTVSLSLSEWSRAAGVDLDDASYVNNQAIGTNTFYPDNSEIQSPLLRNTGFELTLQIAYFDPLYLDEDYGFDGVIAKVQVKGNIDWASRLVTDYGGLSYANSDLNTGGQAETRFRYYYGVRFVFKEGASGKFGYLIIPALLVLIVVVATYMGFVVKFMKIFLTKLLGDTSRNYKRAQQDSFNPDRDGQQTMPAKAIMAAACFQYLVDKQNEGRGFATGGQQQQSESEQFQQQSQSQSDALINNLKEGNHNTSIPLSESEIELSNQNCQIQQQEGVHQAGNHLSYRSRSESDESDYHYKSKSTPIGLAQDLDDQQSESLEDFNADQHLNQKEGAHNTPVPGLGPGGGATGITKLIGKPLNTSNEKPKDLWGASLDADFLFEVLQVAFGNQLDEHSIKDMAFNVFTSISREEEFGAESQVGQGANADKRYKRQNELSDTPVMHLESFVRAVLRSDPVDMPALVNMYDQLDTESCVEGLFGESINTTKPDEPREGRRRSGYGGKTDLTSYIG